MKKLDFCYGQDLEKIDEIPVEGVVLDEHLLPQEASLLQHLKYTSKTSRLLLCGGLSLLVLLPFVTRQTGSSMLVLGLVFVQPVLILYFFYWRTNRKHALLDYVIKLFVCGFAVATTQSMFFESFLQLVFGVVLAVVLAIFDPNALSELTGAADKSNASSMVTFLLDNPMVQLDPAPLNSTLYHMDLRSLSSLPMDLSGGNSTSVLSSMTSATARHHVLIALAGLLFMAYVVAAGVEETMKHFDVRCCRFPEPLKNPHTVMVYMLCGALGFATAENIEYVFGTKTSPVPGTSLLVGELFVLLMRVCLPVHLICSVLQAANYSQV